MAYCYWKQMCYIPFYIIRMQESKDSHLRGTCDNFQRDQDSTMQYHCHQNLNQDIHQYAPTLECSIMQACQPFQFKNLETGLGTLSKWVWV